VLAACSRKAAQGDEGWKGETEPMVTEQGNATYTYQTYLCLKSRELHLYFRRRQIEGGDGMERKAAVGSVESAVDAPPKHTPTVTMTKLRTHAD